MIFIFKKLLKYTVWIAKQTKTFFLSLTVLTIIGVISSLAGTFIALASKKLFDSAQFGQIDSLLQAGLLIISLVLLQVIMQSLLTIFAPKISTAISNQLRQKLFDKLCKTEWLEFINFHSGDLLTRMTSDIDAVTNGVTSVLPSMIGLFFNLCSSLVVLILFDPLLALLAFALGPLAIIFTRLFSEKLKEYHLRIQETESSFRSFLQERLTHMHIIKAFRLENESSVILRGFQNTKLNWVIKRSRLNAVSSAILTVSYWMGFLLATLWGSVRLAQGKATFGTITVFLQLVGQIQEPFVGLAYSLPQVIIMYASAGRLMKLYELQNENFTDEKPLWNSAGIRSEHLEFYYDQNTAVLQDTNFNIKPGEMVAVVGASGEGKTTLIRLILSLLKPTKGGLLFYNPETKEKISADVITRSLTAYVPQGNTLFSGTIAENVLLGNRNANEQEIREALENACISDFIDSLPEKQNAIIGENGYGLSEGQIQRISIARALISKKPVLVLDEATSALDAETELKVLNSIASLNPHPTCIIITHRKAALDYCSKILSLENGSIQELHTDL